MLTIRNKYTRIRALITCTSVLLIVAHLIWPELSIDATTTALAVIAIVPWLSFIIESADFPGGWKIKFHEIRDVVEAQGRIISNQQKILNDLVIFSMAHFLFDHLKGIYYAQKFGEEYIFRKNDDFVDDLRYLRDNGYIEILGIRNLKDGQNLTEVVTITPIGRYYVELRESREKELSKVAIA